MSNEKETLFIFGYPINIQPNGFVVTVEKFNDEMVTIRRIDQSRSMMQMPINTVKDFDKTADEFIEEFQKQNHFATKHNLMTEPMNQPNQDQE